MKSVVNYAWRTHHSQLIVIEHTPEATCDTLGVIFMVSSKVIIILLPLLNLMVMPKKSLFYRLLANNYKIFYLYYTSTKPLPIFCFTSTNPLHCVLDVTTLSFSKQSTLHVKAMRYFLSDVYWISWHFWIQKCQLIQYTSVVLVYYPGHLATAIHFSNDVRGDYLMLSGTRYTICDPTYIGASVGMTMPDMDNSKATVILLE